ncbi:hypothetical protein KUCAC02_003505 [Chaenocephalus aceratus]|uniref:Uncharacterized protein n=1 Tax=Chaenocephalus aceratus TaxID=36190 RepID=A0ACB9WLR4_CHAAC|nr:hypothetical protein KUCAC02_003505 [Chaenocephalus aceratus]
MPGLGSCTSIINLRFQEGQRGKGRQFVDRTFPPDSSSLEDLPELSSRQESQVKWLRPAEILKNQNNSKEAIFCTKGASRFDFGQGAVGNCWFLAAISSLTFRKALMVQVVPMDQNFNNHAGIFHFRFWRFGKWVDVVIDDYLPLMPRCADQACKDFCGGVNVDYKLQEVHSAGHDDKLWSSLSNASSCNSMICCGTAQKGGVLVNTVSNSGIVDAHAYSVTAVTEINYRGSKVRLVRLFNPWGRKEWTGNWSDKSDRWQRVSPNDRAKCEDRDDGEFWMELKDFCLHFSMLFICCENPNFIDGDVTCQWQSQTYDGKWTAGRSAGGSLSNRSFETNPQYRMKVNIIDKSEKEDKNIVLTLMQKPRQENRKGNQLTQLGSASLRFHQG